ncbi:hypothetical protein EVA_15949, partial [gut metagenome]
PLQHILHISKDLLNQIAQSMGTMNNMYFQSDLIQKVKSGAADLTAFLSAEQIASIQNFNVNFFGVDLTLKPEMAFNALLTFPRCPSCRWHLQTPSP